MRRLKVTLAYDGTDFIGWQCQKNGRSVEGEIMKSLSFMHKASVSIDAAGRTDSGVHASGQVISYNSDLDSIPIQRYCQALNSFLPKDVRARLVEEVEPGFHARHDARERAYKYYLFPSEVPEPHYRLYSHRIVRRPDIRKLNEMASVLVGTHDFTSFCVPSADSPDRVRTIFSASFSAEGPFLVFTICGSGFLWRMVRSIVGSLLSYESDKASASLVAEVLQARDHALAGPSAPAWGLFLHKVRYKNETLVF